MRNTQFYLLLVFSLFIFSCGDDPEDPSEGGFEGTWNLVGLDYTGQSVTDFGVGGTITQDFEGLGRNFDASVTFNKDMTYTAEGNYIIELMTTSLGQTVTTTETIEGFLDNGTYTLDNSENPTLVSLTTGAGDVSVADISVLNETDMDFSISTTAAQSTAAGTITTTIDSNYELER